MIKQKKILFLIRSLEKGGAERQLVLLACGLSERGWKVAVITFYHGLFEAQLKQKGIDVCCLEKKGRWELLGFFKRLISSVKREDALILHSYLTVGNILATMVKLFIPKLRVVWGVRASDMKLESYDWTAGFTDRLEACLAWIPTLIIANSRAGGDYLIRRGFPSAKIVVIPNGIDTALFSPNLIARQQVRNEWDIKDDEILVGLVARIDPMKDHHNFLKAAALVAARCSNVRFVCVGDGRAVARRPPWSVSARMASASLARSPSAKRSPTRRTPSSRSSASWGERCPKCRTSRSASRTRSSAAPTTWLRSRCKASATRPPKSRP